MLAVRAKGDGIHIIIMRQISEFATAGDLPHCGGVVITCGGYILAIRTEGDRAHAILVCYRSELATTRRLPDRCGIIFARCGHTVAITTEDYRAHILAIRAKGDSIHNVFVRQHSDAATTGGLPYARRIVLT